MLDPEALGLGFEGLVFVTLYKEDQSTLAAFDEAFCRDPPTSCMRSAFSATPAALYEEQLMSLPGVQNLTSTIVMKQIVDARPLPT
ncbi:Lrp/AsnC family transcriptional regulator [Streptomyces ipomoeae]|nr:Lrp/AsnC family transcriptional regulator [Streptomyces ipomoeae]MDX2939325.1 Lrp/AsnC family transcriptional regulator [Streptomyces ipomoeae]